MWMQLALIALAGAAGTLARYGVSILALRLPWGGSPLGTLTVNVAGSFLFGLIWPMVEMGRLRPETRTILLTGFMGAFTTFSTFAFETGQFLRVDPPQYGAAAINLIANNVFGIAAFLLGIWIASRS